MWILIVILGHALNAGAFLVDKYLLAKKLPNPVAYSFVIGVLGLLAFLLAPFGLRILSQFEFILSLLSGAIFVLALFFFFGALKCADTSKVVTFVGALQPIMIYVLAFWWLGERLSANQIMAFVLLMIGGVLVTLEHTSYKGFGHFFARQKNRESYWIMWAIVAALLFAISFVFVKDVFNESNFISGLVWSRLGGAFMALLYLLIPRARRRIFSGLKTTQDKKQAGSLVLISQGAGALGFILISYAISLASVTLVQAMQGIQYALLFLMVWFMTWRFPHILKEKFSREILIIKICAILFIGMGLVILVL